MVIVCFIRCRTPCQVRRIRPLVSSKAILSALLNAEKLDVGPNLTSFKEKSTAVGPPDLMRFFSSARFFWTSMFLSVRSFRYFHVQLQIEIISDILCKIYAVYTMCIPTPCRAEGVHNWPWPANEGLGHWQQRAHSQGADITGYDFYDFHKFQWVTSRLQPISADFPCFRTFPNVSEESTFQSPTVSYLGPT